MELNALIRDALGEPMDGRAFRVGSKQRYEALVQAGREDNEAYWMELGRQALAWRKPFARGLDCSEPTAARWFSDGEISVSENCLDIHPPGRTAFIFERDDGGVERVSYGEMLERVCRLAAVLESRGVQAGQSVLVYMPMIPDAVVAMHACARIGAVHSVVFGGFSAEAVASRAKDAGAVAVVTADLQRRGGKLIALKSTVDAALSGGACPSVHTVVCLRRAEPAPSMQAGRDVDWESECSKQPAFMPARAFPSEHPLFTLYTSGSTGKPKGIEHCSSGYLLHAKVTSLWTFDLRASDVFWCTADVGWITGHSYCAYGPMACGATQVIFEGVPTYPDASRMWSMVQRHGVTVLSTAPTAIRALIKANAMDPSTAPENFDMGCLRIIGSVGEPISPEAWRWFHSRVGGARCPLVDTFWQTETGGHVLTPLPGAHAMVPGSCGLPFPGLDVAVVDPEGGAELPFGEPGVLVIRKPWPSMIRGVRGDPERFAKGYFPEALGGTSYLAGDGAVRDADGGWFRIVGRIDDVLNVSGHRLGTAEIEAALGSHPMIAESAVVPIRDELTGEAVCAFVLAKGHKPEGRQADAFAAEAKAWVSKAISPIARPSRVVFVDSVPKTRSGKIMRRILKAIANGDPINQDISTLDDPAAVLSAIQACAGQAPR